MRAYFATVANEFNYIHVVEDDSLSDDEIKSNIIMEVYGRKIEAEVELIKLNLVNGNDDGRTFAIGIEISEPTFHIRG